MIIKRSFIIASMASALVACGGGGGGGTPTPTPAPVPTPDPAPVATVPVGTTLAVSSYVAGSAEAQIFKAINDYRVQCGFPAFKQNTLLDKAAQNHAAYMRSNGSAITDDEVLGKPGFTGVTGLDRAVALGWPSQLYVGAANTGAVYTNATLSLAEYGQSMLDAFSVGVYHQVVIAHPSALLGIGISQTSRDGFPDIIGGVELGADAATATKFTNTGPLTFPCQGVTGLPYQGVNEVPTPPGTAGSWGTPVTVIGNPTDIVSLSTATMSSAGEGTITLKILNADNQHIGPYQAVAYPVAPLKPNTTYTVALSGLYNGVAFSRSFTFTTGNKIA